MELDEKFKPKESTLKNGETLIIRENFPENAQATLDYLNTVAVESENLFIDEEGTSFTAPEEEEFLKSLMENKDRLMLAGFINSEMVSLGTIDRVSARKRARHRAGLSVSVLKKAWNIGVGTEMVSALLAFAKDIDIENVELEVIASNSAAINLYKKLGFEKVGQYKNYSKLSDRYENADIMQVFI